MLWIKYAKFIRQRAAVEAQIENIRITSIERRRSGRVMRRQRVNGATITSHFPSHAALLSSRSVRPSSGSDHLP
jgi:hypothetical protein